jgi:hypothetical protein
MISRSLRYGGGPTDVRGAFMRLTGALQRKPVVILDRDPEAVERVLKSSHVKGSFLEELVACPAWGKVTSVESVDGEIWRQLAADVRVVMRQIDYAERLPVLIERHLGSLAQAVRDGWVSEIDAKQLGHLTARIMIELVFDTPATHEEAALLYRASETWRKEIAVKGKGDTEVREAWWSWLRQRVADSRWGEELEKRGEHGDKWMSVFAQPFLISPVINLGDVMVAVFGMLGEDASLKQRTLEAVQAGDDAFVSGVVMEAIRLRHPFPVLEREVPADIASEAGVIPAGTQVFIPLDQFKQDAEVRPERWMGSTKDNPYRSLPFGAGRRMCIGKPIATALLTGVLRGLLSEVPFASIRVAEGHRYSGRSNDEGASLSESLYQLGVFGRVLLASYRIGTGACPITGARPVAT